MARQALSAVVEQARITASRSIPDAELLERFLRTRDETAFAALVRRHRPAVLAACRQVLADEADVEDAAQQTFFALWRNVRAIRNRHAVGGWLFGVAHRIAVKSLTTSRRRSVVEGRASESRSEVAQLPDISWREACTILHEELDRLTDKHRLPLLLCYLDGKSRDEAAKQLGWSVGAVKGHLQRGRVRLRDRLARRGVTLSAGLLAAAVTSRATAGPAVPVASILKAVLATSPRRVVGVTTGVQVVAGLAVMMTVVAVGVGSRVATTEADEPPKAAGPQTPSAKAPAAAEMLTLTGRVLRPDGTPAAGAKLYSYHTNPERATAEEPYSPIVRGTGDADGRFRIDVPKADLDVGPGGDPLPIVAAADGFGIDWSPVTDPRQEMTLRLVPDQPIAGRVVDSEGRPVADATIDVRAVQTTRHEKLDDYFDAIKTFGRDPMGPINKRLYHPGNLLPTPARPNAAGRFRLSGAGAERMTVLKITAPSIAHDVIYVIGRAGFDPTPYRRGGVNPKPDTVRRPEPGPPLYGPTFDYVATPGKIVEGTVVSTDGQPIAGARVSTTGRSVLAATTDMAGRFRLTGVRKQPSYDLMVAGDEKSAYLSQTFRVTDSEGLQPVRAEMRLTRGVVVSGRVIDPATGAGVQAAIHFAPLPGNAYYGKLRYESYQRPREYSLTTAADGSFRLPVLPGLGVILCQARGGTTADGQSFSPFLLAELDAEDAKRTQVNTKGYARYLIAADNGIELLDTANVVKVIDLPPDAGPTTVDLNLRRGKTATVTILDADGKALSGAVVGGTAARPWSPSPLKTAECTLYALDPKRPRELIVYHLDRRLAGMVTVRGDEAEPVAIRLAPTGVITGRALDAEGHPVAGTQVEMLFPSTVAATEIVNYLRPLREPVRTDNDGRFRIEGVVPGLKVSLIVRMGSGAALSKSPLGPQEVKPGATLDVGEFRTEPRPQ
jgi:RNA polymerase sigma factor (sigma-70 family)